MAEWENATSNDSNNNWVKTTGRRKGKGQPRTSSRRHEDDHGRTPRSSPDVSYTLSTPPIDLSQEGFSYVEVKLRDENLSQQDWTWLTSADQISQNSKKDRQFIALNGHFNSLKIDGVGVSPLLHREHGFLRALCFSASHRAIVLRFGRLQRSPNHPTGPRGNYAAVDVSRDFLEQVLTTNHHLYSFGGSRTAILIRRDLAIPVALYDLSTAVQKKEEAVEFFPSPRAAADILTEIFPHQKRPKAQFAKLWQIDSSDKGEEDRNGVLRAWLSFRTAAEYFMRNKEAAEKGQEIGDWEGTALDTRRLPNDEGSRRQGGPILNFFFDAIRIVDELDRAKPHIIKADFHTKNDAFKFREAQMGNQAGGTRFVEITNNRFQTRIRNDNNQTVILHLEHDSKIQEVFATVCKSNGSTVQLAVKTNSPLNGDIVKIEISGKPASTLAEVHWLAFLTSAMKGDLAPLESAHNSWVLFGLRPSPKSTALTTTASSIAERSTPRGSSRRLLRSAKIKNNEDLQQVMQEDRNRRARVFGHGTTVRKAKREKVEIKLERANESQKQAIVDIISGGGEEKGHTVLIQGPPGTGKTTVIAHSINEWIQKHPHDFEDSDVPLNERKPIPTIYCVTASNVAGKNIAEALVKKAFLDFKIVISDEFYKEWHEDIYVDCRDKIVRSSFFSKEKDEREIWDLMQDIRVVICTLSMLSSENLKNKKFFKIMQMKMLLVDEASQIRVDDYPHVFHYFRNTLNTVAFFGDHKQLAPYQSQGIRQIQSVFERPHLEEGNNDNFHFLDIQYRMPQVVGDFLSEKMYNGKLKSADSVHPSNNAVLFVDCAHGSELSTTEGGTKNNEEVETIVELVRIWYYAKEFKIITPYDAQRDSIQKALKSAELPWKDKVYNVDSFQGQESDYILISVVRTEKVGFLKEPKRSNVMLSRLKKGMVIVTNRAFCQGPGKDTLVAQLGCVNGARWISPEDIASPDVIFP